MHVHALFRDEILALFNYNTDNTEVMWRGLQSLNTTNLTTFLAQEGVTSICQVILNSFKINVLPVDLYSELFQEPVRRRFQAYCIMAEALPSLDKVMKLMQLAR